jgi:hypothetical protein
VFLTVSDDADRLWCEELNRIEARYPSANEEEGGFLGHIKGRILRFAAILALLEDPAAREVSADSMRQALHWGQYFMRQNRFLSRNQRLGGREKQIEAVRRWGEGRRDRGKDLTVRDLAKSYRRYQGREGATLAVAHLRAAGFHPIPQARPSQRGGRPRQVRWSLTDPSAKPAKPSEREHGRGSAGFADVNAGVNGQKANLAEQFLSCNQALELDIPLPPGGTGRCPGCRHNNCFGQIQDDPHKWKCFSNSHRTDSGWEKDSGDLVDLHLAETVGRLPSTTERVTFVRKNDWRRGASA